MKQVPAGVALLVVLLSSSLVLLFGAFLLLRPDWLGLSSRPLSSAASSAADSLAVLSTEDSLLLPSPWEELQQQLHIAAAREAMLLDSLKQLHHSADSLRAELEKLRSELHSLQQQLSQQSDSVRWHHYEAFAKIYNSAPPEDVARILQQLPPQEAARILKAMNRRQAARVIAALPPDYAAAALNLPVPAPSP